VPVLVDGDFTLWESNTICRYLCGRQQNDALLPREARTRAAVEQWMDWQATELNNAWRYAFMALVTLADIVIGFSLNRWAMTPMARPDYPHVAACLARLAERPGCRAWCANGVP
jgi:glutathione S-transferase